MRQVRTFTQRGPAPSIDHVVEIRDEYRPFWTQIAVYNDMSDDFAITNRDNTMAKYRKEGYQEVKLG